MFTFVSMPTETGLSDITTPSIITNVRYMTRSYKLPQSGRLEPGLMKEGKSGWLLCTLLLASWSMSINKLINLLTNQ